MLGFVLAATLIGILMSLDWRHYIRYWASFNYLGQPTVARIFFMLWVVVCGWRTVIELAASHLAYG